MRLTEKILKHEKKVIKSEKFLMPNTWLHDSKMRIYIRISNRKINKKKYICLDLASIEVYPEEQEKGVFSSLLKEVESKSISDAIFIENVMSDRFAEFFRKKGWNEYGHSARLPQSFFRVLKK